MEHNPDADELEPDDDEVSGMPEGEPELAPMGIAPETGDEDASDEPSLPGFPSEDEPDVSG